MKTINYKLKFLILAVLTLSLGSCSDVLDDDLTDFGNGPNFVGFTGSSYSLGVVADGSTVSTGIPVVVDGPSVPNINGDITVTFTVNPSSTAVEGVNYTLASNTFTLSPDDGDSFRGILPISIITEGITPPLAVAPTLNLTITEISGGENLVISDKAETVDVTIGYACPFNIKDYEGTYMATTDEFGIYLSQPTPLKVVAGPGENQITLVDVAGHPEMFDVVVDVDPASGDLTVAKQPLLNYNNFGSTQYGELRIEGGGSSETGSGFCLGKLEITGAYTVDAGSFGEYTLVFEKTAGAGTDTDTDTDTEDGES